jgi:hypothetical protein
VSAVEISYWMAQPDGLVVNKSVSNFVVEYYDVVLTAVLSKVAVSHGSITSIVNAGEVKV